MKLINVDIPDDHAYIVPIGDIHFGDPAFRKEGLAKLQGYLDWVKERPNARVLLNGDVFNVGSRSSATSPFNTDPQEYENAIAFFAPYASQIILAIDGNHEIRMLDEFGYSPLSLFCRALHIPYCQYSAVVRLRVGKRPEGSGNRYYQQYYIYCHHTTGGGTTIGGKLNRVVKLRDIIEGVDVFCGSHNHQLAAAPQDVYYPSHQGGVRKRRVWYVDCGSFLSWEGSYAEQKMMSPTKLGSPRIRFSGKPKHHDVHVSI